MNEDGEMLYDFGTAYSISEGNFHSNNNETRFCIFKALKEGNNLNYSTTIYRCNGPGVASISPINQEENTLGNAYPNPSHSMITLPYRLTKEQCSEMHIYNINGQLIKTIPIGPHFNEVVVDVSSFPSGMYIYEYERKTNKFIVN